MKNCLICGKEFVARELCAKHYKQWQRHGVISSVEYRHGLARSPFYNSWRGMKERSQKHPIYIRRNILLCKKWNTFLNFKNDMYEAYLIHFKKHGPRNTTIERIDNTKGYFKENCRWATYREQWRNKSNTRLITFKGKSFPLSEWARNLNMSPRALHYRLQKWPIDKVFVKKAI